MTAHWLERLRSATRVGASALALTFAAPALAADLTIAQSTDAVSLDPAFRADTATGNVQRHIFDSVLHRGPDMKIGPQLAESVGRTEPPRGRSGCETGSPSRAANRSTRPR